LTILLVLGGTDTVFAPKTVRYGYFNDAQPFGIACARGWLDMPGYEVTCMPQSSGGYAVSKLDIGDLEVAMLGSTPIAV
jgi:ABC-type taurine transport system substrate-binding protein